MLSQRAMTDLLLVDGRVVSNHHVSCPESPGHRKLYPVLVARDRASFPDDRQVLHDPRELRRGHLPTHHGNDRTRRRESSLEGKTRKQHLLCNMFSLRFPHRHDSVSVSVGGGRDAGGSRIAPF